jgi:N-hydroxyarylamine O-acetyltransferase
MTDAFDLDAYLARIGYTGPRQPDLAILRALHLAHVQAIPFENLNIQLRLPVPLDVASLQAKMVQQRRGGYCFEQNTLFGHVLTAVGLTDVLQCEARVRQGMTQVRPRTHMVLVTTLDGVPWLADVGFGADGIMEPVRMDGSTHEQYGRRYRVAEDGELRVLQRAYSGGWEDLYAFLPAAVHPIDFEVGNWFCATYPSSAFLKTVTAQRSTPEARHILRGLTYTIARGEHTETREVARDELVPLLREVFGIDLPDDARFRAIDECS